MAWLVALTLLGLLFLCPSVTLLFYHRAKVDDLRAVIRAQRRCMDRLESELACPYRKGHESAGAWDFGGRGRYPIEPSAN